VLQRIAAAFFALVILAVLGVSGAYVYLQPSLPTAEQMKEISLQVPLRIYARNGQVMAQIGEQRRRSILPALGFRSDRHPALGVGELDSWYESARCEHHHHADRA
jgi:membrane carboxypeptidase/penicillin-binding protein